MAPTHARTRHFIRALLGIGLIALTTCRVGDSDEMAGTAPQQHRPLEGRIHGAGYAPWSSTDTRAVTHQDLREIARRMRSHEPEELQARAALSAGGVRHARSLLERLTSHGNASAAAWSDYSATLHAEAAGNDVFTLAAALAAADHALDIDPAMPEALFNRALALETMSLRGPAVTAYTKYLQVDGTSPWRPEVQARIEKLKSAARAGDKSRRAIARAAESGDELLINDTAIAFPQESRYWGEGPCLGAWAEHVLDHDATAAELILKRCRIIGRALETQFGDSFLADVVRAIDQSGDATGLARAHAAYARGSAAGTEMKLATSITALEEARRRFDANGSPMTLLAQLHLATNSLVTGNADRSQALSLRRRGVQRSGGNTERHDDP